VTINTKANKQWFTASKPAAPAFVLLHQDWGAPKAEQQNERSFLGSALRKAASTMALPKKPSKNRQHERRSRLLA
jgi:ribosomal protein L11